MNRTELSSLGEFALIDHLTQKFETRHTTTIKGIGDDAAVIGNPQDEEVIVLTTDILLEGIHFDLIYVPLKHLGYKAISVNVSDICAMNATPQQVTVSIAVSNRFSVEALDELYEGIRVACKKYNIDLIGGDTTTSHRGLFISITAVGKVEKRKITYRNTAQIGDLICVSGDLGAAYLGLQLMEREKRIFLENPAIQPNLEGQKYIVGRQLKPEARIDIIQELAKKEILPTSMIDISDGLASEILHICKASKLGAYIEEANLPIHNDTYNMAFQFGIDATTCALNGGEDYELLFTVSPNDIDAIKSILDISIIGEMIAPEDGVTLHSKGGRIHPIIAQGWQHFKEKGTE